VSDKNIWSSSKHKISHKKKTLETEKQIVQIPETCPAKSLALIITSMEHPVLREFCCTSLNGPSVNSLSGTCVQVSAFQALDVVQVLESLDQTSCSR